ncbi:MAG: hypothetical protein GY731_16765 [Gammaproteobacteria bacterium]|nr:hypothetical protein [Gammaproteobacteria bacterium]
MSLVTRVSNLFRGFLSIFVSDLEKKNPQALLELEKENLRKLISQYNEGLAAHAGLSERLMTQVKKLELEQDELTAKTTAHLKAGNQDVAAQYALRLQTVQRELKENRTQLEQEEATYKNLVRTRDLSINEAKAKIESITRTLGDLKVKRATAELTEMAAGMISEIGGSGDTLNRLEEMVEEEREAAAGRARVARDSLSVGDLDVQEVEQKAMANQALASFAADAGIALESESSAAPAEPSPIKDKSQGTKTMGPGTVETE